jgi:elongation factor G
MSFPEPVISLAVEPKTTADNDKLTNGLVKLAEEDPTFRVRTDEESGQTIISGMGELHLEILVDRLKREFKVEVNQGAPQVAYREAITKKVEHRELYKKQTGGRGKFADIHVEIGPAEKEGEHFEFVDEIKGGVIPKEFIPAVKKGLESAMGQGVLAGFPMSGVRARLFFGSYHDVDSDQLSFEIAGRMAMREACRKANPVLLEPIMAVEVVTPEEYMGSVEGMDSRGTDRVVKAKVPLSEMFGYVTQLRTISSGRAVSTMQFSHYAQAPRNIQDEVVAKVRGEAARA